VGARSGRANAADAKERFPKIAAWEDPNDDSRPTYVQLEKLADTFKVPIAVFFFPSPPDVPSITNDFRPLPATEMNLIAPKIRLLLRKAKAYQLSLAELNGGRNPAPRKRVPGMATREYFQNRIDEQPLAEYLGVPPKNVPGIEDGFLRWRARA